MISSAQLADFVSLIAPGFIAIEVFRSAYPVKTRNDKSNLYLYVVYSLIAGVLLALAYRLPPGLFFGLGIPSREQHLLPIRSARRWVSCWTSLYFLLSASFLAVKAVCSL